jgi:hypothetical protein
MLFIGVVYWMLSVGCCLLAVVYWLLSIGCCILGVVCWLLSIGCCLLGVVYWLLSIGCCLLAVVYWLLYIGCCLLGVVYWLLSIGCCILASVDCHCKSLPNNLPAQSSPLRCVQIKTGADLPLAVVYQRWSNQQAPHQIFPKFVHHTCWFARVVARSYCMSSSSARGHAEIPGRRSSPSANGSLLPEVARGGGVFFGYSRGGALGGPGPIWVQLRPPRALDGGFPPLRAPGGPKRSRD